MQVEDIMTKDVSFCKPGTNAAVAAGIMWTKNFGCLPVVEDGGHVVGMVTDRDLFIALGTSDRKPADLCLGEVMNGDLAACSPGDDIRVALKTMAQRQVRRLPVVDEVGVLKGILSLSDITLRAADQVPTDVLNAMRMICDRRNYRKGGQRSSLSPEQAAA